MNHDEHPARSLSLGEYVQQRNVAHVIGCLVASRHLAPLILPAAV